MPLAEIIIFGPSVSFMALDCSGVRVKINDSYYLVGLTRSDADAAHNLDILSTDNWLDFPLLLNDDRIAKLTFEKGATGDQVMAQALNAWK